MERGLRQAALDSRAGLIDPRLQHQVEAAVIIANDDGMAPCIRLGREVPVKIHGPILVGLRPHETPEGFARRLTALAQTPSLAQVLGPVARGRYRGHTQVAQPASQLLVERRGAETWNLNSEIGWGGFHCLQFGLDGDACCLGRPSSCCGLWFLAGPTASASEDLRV